MIHESPSLFSDDHEGIELRGPIVPREKARKRAFEKADKLFLERYEQQVIEHGSVHATFVAADVTERYEKVFGAIAEHNAKGLGGLYGDLQRRMVIEKTGEAGKRKNGNVAAEYRLRK